MRYHVSIKFSSDNKLIVLGNEIEISIKSAPRNGRANAELVMKLSKYFGVSPESVHILSGLYSRKKIVDVT